MYWRGEAELCDKEAENIIILITGASHTGKTMLAYRMIEKYKYPCLSIDNLKVGLIRSGNTDFTAENDDELLGYLWSITREIIKTSIENKQDLIVEGFYIPFDWRQDFYEQYLQVIRFICLAMSDEYINRHFCDIIKHRCKLEARADDSYSTIDKARKDNRRIIEGYRKSGKHITLITSNYKKSIRRLLNGYFGRQ